MRNGPKSASNTLGTVFDGVLGNENKLNVPTLVELCQQLRASADSLVEVVVMDPFDIIRDAILEKKQVTGYYRGHYREMCPHVLGTKNGRAQALFYQFGGSSSSGLPADGEWRCIPLGGLSEVSSQAGAWYTSTGHTQPQTCVDAIEVEVAY